MKEGDINPIAIAVIATSTVELQRPPAMHIQQERRFREALREYPPQTVLDIPFCRMWHREFYLNNPYLDVSFMCMSVRDPTGWMMGRFMHEPLLAARTAEDVMSQNPWYYWEDCLVLRLEGAMGGSTRHRCSPALLKAIRRVLYEPDTYDDIARQYAESNARSRRESLQNLTAAMTAGWTREDYAHWVQTGEEPKFEEGGPDVDP